MLARVPTSLTAGWSAMTELSPSLVELAARHGVATRYEDWSGTQVAVPESTLIAVLAALGVAAADDEQRAAALIQHDRNYWQRSLPPTILARTGSTSSFWVHVTHGDPVEVCGPGRRVDPPEPAPITQRHTAFRPRRPTGRGGQLRAARRSAAGLPPGAHADRNGRGRCTADRLPATLPVPPRLGARRSWGWRPSSTAFAPTAPGVSAT